MNEVNEYLKELKDQNIETWEKEVKITEVEKIPEEVRLQVPHWYKIRNVTVVYADMCNSSSVNVKKYRHASTKGKIYEAFTGTCVRIFKEFEVREMDIQGDGILGIWDGPKSRYLAFSAAVTFKTYVNQWLSKWVKDKIDPELDIQSHIGMDEYEVFVKYIGMKGENKNQVWAGEPVTIAVKLCQKATENQLVVSDRLYQAFNLDEIYLSCSCTDDPDNPGKRIQGDKTNLWEEVQFLEEDVEFFGFDKAWLLKSQWCEIHGNEFCRIISDKGS